MPTVPLAKPGTLGVAVLQVIRGDATTPTMAVKIQACDIEYAQRTEETTGSNPGAIDAYEVHEGNGLLGGQIAIQGLLLSQATVTTTGGTDFIGIQNIFDNTDELSRMRWSVGLANGIYLQGKMIVRSCRIRWVRTAATVQVTITGVITDTSPANTESGISISP